MGIEIKGIQQFKDKISGDKPVIIDFSAKWCGPCKTISPVFNELAEDAKYKNNAHFVTIDVDDEEEIAQEVGIRAMPTFMVFKNGDKIDSILGADKEKLKNLVQKHASESSA